MSKSKIARITTHLWFAKDAIEAVEFCVSVFPDSSLDRVTNSPADTHCGPAGSVQLVDFTLAGLEFMAINEGPLEGLLESNDLSNTAISRRKRCN